MEKNELNNLIVLSIKNDSKAFRKIVEHYQNMVYCVAFRMLCNEEDAEDIVQETFIKLWKNLKKYNDNYKLSTWLYSISVNLCLDKLKSTKTIHINLSENDFIGIFSSENPEQKLINSDIAKLISTLTNKLTPKQKMVFTLRFIEGLDTNEIVKITKMTPKKIKYNLYLARKKMKEILKNYEK
ncbi:MAG: sigma-70 family RNA polymerase sigma factor [Prevotellaceae bacterium]|jgi:RNA polymerase sigma-70 factor (ECF subfamily)|nr:sigma-70 family RNA polymerase sigma factor [Prevotellaceae bacterium]